MAADSNTSTASDLDETGRVDFPAVDDSAVFADDDPDNGAGFDSSDQKQNAVKMKDLLAAVVAKTGAKKKDAKDVIDAVLAEMAAALVAGKPMVLPPLGNLRVAKTMDKGGTTMMVLKLRLGGGDKGAKQTLADEGEDS
jgi:hypothetical protein